MRIKSLNVVAALILTFTVVLSACAPSQSGPATAELPVGKAYVDGKEIYFVHTEVSDADIADLLTKMMNSPVLVVPALADVPDSALANVYVFDNGPKGMGPLGFQADVFDNPPGSQGYSPLRKLNIVSWADPANARELKAVSEILDSEKAGELSIAQPGIVVNMPFVVWEGGMR